MVNFNSLLKIKWYILALSILVSVFVYAGLTGWKFFGSNTEKWEPTDEKKYHK